MKKKRKKKSSSWKKSNSMTNTRAIWIWKKRCAEIKKEKANTWKSQKPVRREKIKKKKEYKFRKRSSTISQALDIGVKQNKKVSKGGHC